MTVDPRITQLAENLLGYSLKVQPGEVVYVDLIGADTHPLGQELVRLATARGAIPYWHAFDDALAKPFFQGASEAQHQAFAAFHKAIMERVDAYVGVRGPANPFESLARAYTAIYPNRSREYKVRYLSREFERYGVDATVFHDARTSPEHSGVRYGMHIRLRRDTGVEPLVIEGDTHDLRLVSVDHIRSQLQEFLEHRRIRAESPGTVREGLTH